MSRITDLRKTIGYRLKELRKSISYTQEKMATHFGLKRTSYSKYEIGETAPNYLVLEKLGNDFDTSLDWLICGKGPMIFKEKTAGETANTQPEAGINQVENDVLPIPCSPRQEQEGKSLSREHRELVEHMEKIPLLHYEVMGFYHRFKIDNKELVETAVNASKQGG
jgi:transcriptional regulator with XRE-family HTH domain